MAHNIHGIITSFKYKGTLPNVILVGNYHFIPFKNRFGENYSENKIAPYDELTKENIKILKNLSFFGKCAYIETEYFGGTGTQLSETWENGKRINGPLISYDGIENPQIPKTVKVIENSINQTLKIIGIYQHEGKDEFDSIRLGNYRSNNEIFEEYKNQNKS